MVIDCYNCIFHLASSLWERANQVNAPLGKGLGALDISELFGRLPQTRHEALAFVARSDKSLESC